MMKYNSTFAKVTIVDPNERSGPFINYTLSLSSEGNALDQSNNLDGLFDLFLTKGWVYSISATIWNIDVSSTAARMNFNTSDVPDPPPGPLVQITANNISEVFVNLTNVNLGGKSPVTTIIEIEKDDEVVKSVSSNSSIISVSDLLMANNYTWYAILENELGRSIRSKGTNAKLAAPSAPKLIEIKASEQALIIIFERPIFFGGVHSQGISYFIRINEGLTEAKTVLISEEELLILNDNVANENKLNLVVDGLSADTQYRIGISAQNVAGESDIIWDDGVRTLKFKTTMPSWIPTLTPTSEPTSSTPTPTIAPSASVGSGSGNSGNALNFWKSWVGILVICCSSLAGLAFAFIVYKKYWHMLKKRTKVQPGDDVEKEPIIPAADRVSHKYTHKGFLSVLAKSAPVTEGSQRASNIVKKPLPEILSPDVRRSRIGKSLKKETKNSYLLFDQRNNDEENQRLIYKVLQHDEEDVPEVRKDDRVKRTQSLPNAIASPPPVTEQPSFRGHLTSIPMEMVSTAANIIENMDQSPDENSNNLNDLMNRIKRISQHEEKFERLLEMIKHESMEKEQNKEKLTTRQSVMKRMHQLRGLSKSESKSMLRKLHSGLITAFSPGARPQSAMRMFSFSPKASRKTQRPKSAYPKPRYPAKYLVIPETSSTAQDDITPSPDGTSSHAGQDLKHLVPSPELEFGYTKELLYTHIAEDIAPPQVERSITLNIPRDEPPFELLVDKDDEEDFDRTEWKAMEEKKTKSKRKKKPISKKKRRKKQSQSERKSQ